MVDSASPSTNKPVWIDLATTDPEAARAFYRKVFGWDLEVEPDPQYEGYATADVGGQNVAGIGGTQSPEQPSAWSLYIGTDDAGALATKVSAAGGTIVTPPFPVAELGHMAVFQDPSGTFLSAWQAKSMRGFGAQGANTFGWGELNARHVDSVVPFYRDVFGWSTAPSDDPGHPYTEFQVDGTSIAGATEMDPMVPDEVPNYWLVYFTVTDVDATHRVALEAGAQELLAPIDFPGGRMAIVRDPQGASFGLMNLGEA